MGETGDPEVEEQHDFGLGDEPLHHNANDDEEEDDFYPDCGPEDDEDKDDEDEEYQDYGPEDEEHEEDGGHDTVQTPTAGWSEDTVQTESMAQLGICIDKVARVIVCIACASVIKPTELSEHLTRTHAPITISAGFSQELADTYDLRTNLDSRPGFIITAIYGLNLLGGFIACDTCGYACKSDQAMAKHIKELEGCRTSKACLVQTFRPSSKRYYFGVRLNSEHPEEPATHSLDPVAYLKSKFAPTPFSETPVKSPSAAQDTNHFLGIEKWHLYVEGKLGSEMMHAVREREPALREEVRICVERFAADIAVKLAKVDHEVRAAMADYIG